MSKTSITHTNRRQFVKCFAYGTVFSSVLGRSWLDHLAGEVQAQSDPTIGILQLKVSDYPALANVNGSVRIAINPLNPAPDNKPNGDFYPVVVNRLATTGSEQFIALSSRCSHMDCAVGALGAILPGSMLCPCHTSTYDIRGRVTGGPASITGNLTQLVSRFDGSNLLKIEVPGLGYHIQASLEPAAVNPLSRIRLVIPTHPNVRYEILFLSDFGGQRTVVPFSSTATGAANLTFLTGDGQSKTVYVDRTHPTGFYLVAVKVQTV